MRKGIGIVDMEYGRVAGGGTKQYHSVPGIPYAKPPVGELRWQRRSRAEPWKVCGMPQV